MEKNNKKSQTRAIKILYIDCFVPYPIDDGIRIRSFNILKEIVNHGYEVTLLCFTNNETEKNVEALKTRLKIDIITVPFERTEQYHPMRRILLSILSKKPFMMKYYSNSRFEREVKQLTEKVDFDLLYVSSPWMTLYGLNINLPKILDVIDSHVLAYLVRFKASKNLIHRFYRYLEYKKWMKVHTKIYPLFNYLLVTAQRDANVVSSYPNTNVVTTPNGVDISYFKPLHLEKIPFSMVFVGLMQEGAASNDAALYFIEEVYPLVKQRIPMARVYIIGKNPTRSLTRLHNSQNIFVTRYVEDVRPYLDQCEIFICPLRMASGIQNKILQAMAMNKPIVTTIIGAGGIEGYDKKDIIVANDAEDFAQQIIELFTNRELLQEVGKGGREFVEKNYSWASAGNKIDQLIKELIKSKKER